MTQMLSNLAIVIGFACIGGGLTYAAWRVITHDAGQQHGPK